MEKRFCQNCGNRLDENTGLCPVCDSKALSKGHKNNSGIIIAILVLIVLLLAGGIFYAIKANLIHFGNKDNQNEMSTIVTTSQDSNEEQIVKEGNEAQATAQTTVTTTESITMASNSDFLFPSDTELLTTEYLDTKSKNEIDLIRNEIYARHGYIFKEKQFYNYFIQQDWYSPTEPDMEKAYAQFNEYEQQNIEILVKYQHL